MPSFLYVRLPILKSSCLLRKSHFCERKISSGTVLLQTIACRARSPYFGFFGQSEFPSCGLHDACLG
jgi:hypothetical protein